MFISMPSNQNSNKKSTLRNKFNALKAAIAVVCALLFLPATAFAEQWRIGVVIYDGVLTSDITGPLEVFGAASRKAWFSDYTVTTISADDSLEVTTEEGLQIKADILLQNAGSYDVLILPSSYSMGRVLKNKLLIDYVKEQAPHAKWLASNCSGAQILAEAGLLNGKKATTWAGGEKGFQRKYKAVDVQVDQNYVIDGNIITSNGGLVSYEAALVLLANLTNEKFSKEISDQLQLPRLLNADRSVL